MNWFKGNIAEAVETSKQKNAIFVVYVEGNDDLSQKFRGFINEPRIKEKLESDQFVAIRVEGGSEAYMQFASIYQIVPLPSLFFIGKNGTPLEIATGITASADELDAKIANVLKAANGGTSGASASVDFITNEQSSAVASSNAVSAPATASPTASHREVVCEGDVCVLKPGTSSEQSNKANQDEDAAQKAQAAKEEEEKRAKQAELQAKVEEAKKIMEQKRKEREAEEARLEKEREIRRRQESKEVHKLKDWQKEQEFKDLKESIRRDKAEEQAARQRILQQIASDRAERAQKFNPTPAGEPQAKAQSAPPKPSATNHDSSRIQFRVPTGDAHTHTFNSSDKFDVVRNYVKTTVLENTGIRDFSLATTFPRREFLEADDGLTLHELGLCPNAVVLVITKASTGPAAVVARSGGIINIFNTVFWGVLSPMLAALNYIKSFIMGGGNAQANNQARTGAQKRAGEEEVSPHDAAKKRNLDRLLGKSGAGVNEGASTSKETDRKDQSVPYRRYGSSNIHRLADQKDSDDENSTWNGNSTQQQ